ncbi:MAG: EF-hand domain-containing protein, partial [Mobilitalea sp.]
MISSVNSYSNNLYVQAGKSLLNKLAETEASKNSSSYKTLSNEVTKSSLSTNGSSLTLEELVERMQQTPPKPISNVSEINSDTSSIDVDGDGMMSTDEYDTLMSQLGIEDAASAEEFFQQYDTNADGEITAAEMEASSPMKPMHPIGPPPEETQTSSSYLDTDGDGTVSTEEYQAAVSALGIENTEAADALFAKYDTDSDGNITSEEILAQQSTIVSSTDNTAAISTSEEFKRVASRILASYEANFQYVFEPSTSST